MSIRAIAATAFVILNPASAEPTQAESPLEFDSCAMIVLLKEDERMEGFLFGYLMGAGAYSKEKIQDGVTFEIGMLWIETYCAKHPQETIYEATEDFFQQFRKSE